METISKFSLNPLATCFIPSSMKNKSLMNSVFPNLGCETSGNELSGAKNGMPIVSKKQTGIDYFGALKGQQRVFSSPVEKRTLDVNKFVTTKDVRGLLSDAVKEKTATDEVFLTSKGVHPAVCEVTEKEIPVKLNGKISVEPKKRTGFEDMSLMEMDGVLQKIPVMGKITKFFQDETLSKIWPLAITNILVMELFYHVGLSTISLNLTLSLNLCSVLKSRYQTITYPKKDTETKSKNKVKSDECHCPPIFGWIVPTEFFGNPLKIDKTCGKEYVHTSYVAGSSVEPHKSEHYTLEDEQSNDGEVITLEQCSSELKAVIKDVCDSLSLSNDQDNEGSSQTEVPEIRKRPLWETKIKKMESELSALNLTDDGSHPLLQDVSPVDTNDKDIASVQRLLGEAFSSHREVPSTQDILLSQSVCNPPCSVWCNKVPTAAKDTYIRFIKNLNSESTVHRKETEAKSKIHKKPLYKRCFSADDTPRSSNSDKAPLLSASNFETRERLLLLRKDPIAFIKHSSKFASRDGNCKSVSKVSAVSEQVAAKDSSNERGSDKWSLYDSADSMWQPLPECVPSNESSQKHSQKRARDMRRQMSVC